MATMLVAWCRQKSDSVKFHLDLTWNDGVLSFFEGGFPNKNKKKNNNIKMSSDMRWSHIATQSWCCYFSFEISSSSNIMKHSCYMIYSVMSKVFFLIREYLLEVDVTEVTAQTFVT